MTTPPTGIPIPKHRPAHGSEGAGSSPRDVVTFGRWPYEGRLRHHPLGIPREEVEALLHSRTAELEREIATLRAEIDRRIVVEKALVATGESAGAAATSRGALLAAVGSELQTTLCGMAAATDLLRQTSLRSDQVERVELLDRSSRWLLRLMSNVLEFSRLDGGHAALEAVDFDVVGAVNATVDLYSARAAEKGVEVIMDIDPAAPTRVRGDATSIRQILGHLLDNAVNFTERGEIVVRLRLENAVGTRSRLRFNVSDTGCGVSPEIQRQLFRPVLPSDADADKSSGRIGLGLAISKRLVDLMGGEINLVSAPGAGSSFWFSIEFDHAADEILDGDSTVLAGRHVLIVDDHPANADLFVRLATTWKMRAGSAGSIATALRYLRSAAQRGDPVDVVLLDRLLADEDGLELAKAMLADQTVGKPKVAVLTALKKRLTAAEVQAGAVAACEFKPIHPRNLRAMLERALNTSKPGVSL